ncbi:MAG: tetratricopeptide repeat protein [Oscillospiraceae bacterium]|nr:tetratricopeptide repeat protein [Oscillospiraceae bacterium]
MNIKLKIALAAASIFLMLAIAVAVVIVGRSGADYEEKLAAAEIYLESRDYDNAIAIYNSIIAENESCAEAYAGLSDAYFAKNRADKAFEILERGARNTDQNRIVMDKMNELFPDGMYADASDGNEDGFEDDNAAVTDVPQSEDPFEEVSETEEITVTTVPEESETESETTTVPTTAATTVPTTAATTVPTTAAPIVVTTAPPVVTTAAPAPVTTVQTTTVTTTATTTVTTTEMLRDVSVTDLTRMSLDEAYSWCSKNNLILNVVGTEDDSAEILSQSPAPNSVVKENSTVIVVLAE